MMLSWEDADCATPVYVFEIAGADGLRFNRGSTLLIVPKVL